MLLCGGGSSIKGTESAKLFRRLNIVSYFCLSLFAFVFSSSSVCLQSDMQSIRRRNTILKGEFCFEKNRSDTDTAKVFRGQKTGADKNLRETKQMKYILMKEADVAEIAKLYMDYYNKYEDGCWKYEKACKRIHQMVTIEDSLCLIQKDNESNTTGFVMGYFKEYDDISIYFLEEIVIFADYQNKGYGKQFLKEIENRVLEYGAKHIELTSVNDEHHMHFYKGFGMYAAANLKILGKHYE